MTEDELKEFLEQNKADIAASVKAKVIDAMTRNLSYSLPSGVQQVVTDFIEKEVVPAVKEHLAESRGAIVSAAIAGAASIGDEIAKVLVTKATENLKGYRANDIMKALFGYH